MSAQSNLATARRVIDKAWNGRDLSILDEVMSEDLVTHDPAEDRDLHGLDELRERMRTYQEAMPDMKVRIEDELASGNLVAMRWSVKGTNDGEFAGNPPTHREVKITGLSMERFDSEGRIVETWDQWDNLGMMAQLGMVPETAGASRR